MSETLHMAPGLDLPRDVVTQKLAFLGRTGSGKTYAATKLAELMLGIDAQVVILDPVGVHYGLRIGADGGRGFKIPVFGGLHGDIVLESTAGAVLADLIVDRGISAVLDVSQFETDTQKARFAEAFATRFFFRKKAAPSAVQLFLEECQEFVPQNPQGGDAQMLHAFTRLAKLGRNFGIGVSLISQRPQEVNKKVLNMTEVMLAFQMRGPQERKTIKDWSSDKALEVDIVDELPSLAVGEAFVSSPQWLQVEKRVKIAKKVTADVSSTPKVGATSTAAARELTPIDLAQLQKTMAATIEKAKAEDPKELQKRIRALEAELKGKGNGNGKSPIAPAPDPAALQAKVDRAVDAAITAEQKRARHANQALRKQLADVLQGLGTRIPTALTTLDHAIGTVKVALTSAIDGIEERLIDPAPAVAPVVARVESTRGVAAAPTLRRLPQLTHKPDPATDGAIGRTPQRMLNALKFLLSIDVDPATRQQVAGFVGISADTGTFRNYLSELRAAGYIVDKNNGAIAITQEGNAIASAEGLPTNLAELHETFLRKQGATPAKMLRILIEAHPDSIERSALAAMVGIDHTTGTFRNYLSDLRSPGLLEDVSKSEVRASNLLFPPGLS